EFRRVLFRSGVKVRVRWEEAECMPSIHDEMCGTPDGAGVVDILEENGELHVVDYKFGHLEVSPVENWQLLSYARGILDRLQFDGAAEQHIRIFLHIVQPRCYSAGGPIRTWQTTAGDARAQWNRLRHAAHDALGPSPRFKTGEHCKYCPARRACPTLKRQTAGFMDEADWASGIEIPADQVGLELFFVERSIAQLTARATGLREQVEANLRADQSIPGWCMEPGQSRTQWAAPLTEVHDLGDMMGVDLRRLDAPTPKQAIKL